MYQDSQNYRPASATHYGARPVSSSNAAQGGSDAASATAAKLLDQIGQVSSLQRQASLRHTSTPCPLPCARTMQRMWCAKKQPQSHLKASLYPYQKMQSMLLWASQRE